MVRVVRKNFVFCTRTPSHVPSVSHVPRLTMQIFSGSQIVDSSCSVILDYDSCSIQDRRTGELLGAGPRRPDDLWDLDWLHPPPPCHYHQSRGACCRSIY